MKMVNSGNLIDENLKIKLCVFSVKIIALNHKNDYNN